MPLVAGLSWFDHRCVYAVRLTMFAHQIPYSLGRRIERGDPAYMIEQNGHGGKGMGAL